MLLVIRRTRARQRAKDGFKWYQCVECLSNCLTNSESARCWFCGGRQIEWLDYPVEIPGQQSMFPRGYVDQDMLHPDDADKFEYEKQRTLAFAETIEPPPARTPEDIRRAERHLRFLEPLKR